MKRYIARIDSCLSIKVAMIMACSISESTPLYFYSIIYPLQTRLITYIPLHFPMALVRAELKEGK